MKNKYQNVGNWPIESANDMNVPVGITISYSRKLGKWKLEADNYVVTFPSIEKKAYQCTAENKEILVELVHKYVVPLYRIALNNLIKSGENWLWYEGSPNE